MKLVIVESPTKSKTIAKYLDDSFTIKASVGHIRDLPKNNKAAIDIAAGFVPHYEIVKGKEPVVRELKRLAKKADVVYLATDPDREGEAIAWHLIQALGLNTGASRIVFHEVTEPAIQDAMRRPRGIDPNLIKAQEARRVLDRLFGYDLSGLIWKKVRYGLSAGRVQSPALRIIVEREREIKAFKPETFWVIRGEFLTGKKSQSHGDRGSSTATPSGKTITLTCSEEPRKREETERIIEIAKKNPWRVTAVKQIEAKRSPRPPFITSTLQQAASSRLGLSPSRTMSIAQKLYEQGLITYMRTDSVNLSREALAAIYAEVEKNFGKDYVAPRAYKTKSKSAQEAHEAIRPTDVRKKTAGASEEQKKLYTLIRERALASQMADAKILRTTVTANVEGAEEKIPDFSATGSIVKFPGWLAADPRARGEDVELPEVKEGEALTLKNITDEEKQTQPPPRYTEAGLIKELEKREIGRPSTYATILSTLQKRGYVEKLGRALKPTDTGEVVSEFLEEHFGNYISDSFTAEMENDLDEIANGEREYVKTLKEFYEPFSRDVKAKEKLKKATYLGDAEAHHACPVCGSPMVVKLGRSGKFLSCKKFPKCLGARKIDGNVMEPPKEIGEECPECLASPDPAKRDKPGQLVEREGRYGLFIACSNYPKCKYVKESKNNSNGTGVKCPEDGGEIVERRGRFGPFYSCSNYPKCKFIMKSRPTGNKCELCGSLIMQGTKTIPERCSNKTCENYNPHKLKKEDEGSE